MFDTPQPFLSSARALSALRRELDQLGAHLKTEIERRKVSEPDTRYELMLLPHRIIAVFAGKAVSFSWVGGASVAEGELLVMEWQGVIPEVRGVAALASAKPTREQSYRPYEGEAGSWLWRANESTFSTGSLLDKWLPAPMGVV